MYANLHFKRAIHILSPFCFGEHTRELGALNLHPWNRVNLIPNRAELESGSLAACVHGNRTRARARLPADDFEAFRSFFKHWQKAVGKAGCP
jgi:hypothetical protein